MKTYYTASGKKFECPELEALEEALQSYENYTNAQRTERIGIEKECAEVVAAEQAAALEAMHGAIKKQAFFAVWQDVEPKTRPAEPEQEEQTTEQQPEQETTAEEAQEATEAEQEKEEHTQPKTEPPTKKKARVKKHQPKKEASAKHSKKIKIRIRQEQKAA